MSFNTSQQTQAQAQAQAQAQVQGTAQESTGSHFQSQSHPTSQTEQGNANANANASSGVGFVRPDSVAARTAKTLTRRPSHPRIQALLDDAQKAADLRNMRTARPNTQIFR